jgi:hypothetical protein
LPIALAISPPAHTSITVCPLISTLKIDHLKDIENGDKISALENLHMMSKAPWRKWRCLILLLSFLAVPFACQADAISSLPADSNPDTPFQVHSREERGLLVAEITSMIGFPFDKVSDALTAPESWCEFIPLIFNVKACTFDRQEDRTLLTIHVGRRFYEPPARTIRLQYRFEVQENGPNRSRILLFAPHGPHGTRDYTIDLEIRPTANGRTAFRFHSSFRPSFRSRIATRVYLSRAGRDKAGFSIERYNERNEPVYVGGVKGMIERNAMRHYLALEAFLDTLHLPEEERFEARLHAWYEATERYPRQLYEMEKEEYLIAKRQERKNQEEMQEKIDAAAGSYLLADP